MYILINREKMLLLRKHPDQRVVSMLADLECSEHAVCVTFCDEVAGFFPLSDLELKLLIKNCNGPDVAHIWSRSTLDQIFMGMCATLPIFGPVSAYELTMQLASVRDSEDAYRYVYGSMQPAPAEGLEELAALLYVAGTPRVEFTPVAPANALGQATPLPVAPRAPLAFAEPDFALPRLGTSTHRIFEFCAKLWQDASYADDESVLKDIKKKAVDKLTAEGLNISTVRVQSQRWYQNRKAACGLA